MTPSATGIDPPRIRQQAAELFVLGFPMILMDMVRRAHPLDARRFRRIPSGPEALAPGLVCEDPRFVRSSAFASLGEEPSRLTLPDMQGRYFTVTLVDSAGESFASIGSRTLAGGAEVTLVGPRWRGQAAEGATLRAPSDVVWAVSRIAAASPADVPAVEALALSQRLGPPSGGPDWPDERPALGLIESPEIACAHQVATLPPPVFLHRLGRLIDAAPLAVQAAIREAVETRLTPLNALLRRIPVPAAVDHALAQGFKDGLAAIRAAATSVEGDGVFGWRARRRAPILAESGATAWAARAYVALGAPLDEDLLPLTCAVDESGRLLSGRERYRLRFTTREQPPVHAFWALTVDQHPGRDPPHDRINERSDLTLNGDGALEIFIQHEPPAGSPDVNWLRAPAGDFTLTADLHWPARSVLDGTWRMPPVERLGSRIAQAQGPSRPLKSRARPPGGSARMAFVADWRTRIMKPLPPALAAIVSAAALGTSLPAQAQAQAAAPAPAQGPAVEPEALQALQRMSAYLGTLSAFEVKADTSMDLILEGGERIQVDGVTTYKVKRPNGFMIETSTDRPVRQAYYNGKQFTLYAPRQGYFATVPAPATIRETLDVASEKYGMVLPLQDLFRWSDPQRARVADVTSGFVVGPARIDGVDTDQYAFREGDIDWQIWITRGDKPTPRKLVIVDRTDEARPAFTARLSWNTAPQLAASTFTFNPGPSAKQIRIGQVTQ